MKELLYNQLKEIKDDGIRNFVKTALDNAPEGFWTIACSGSGRYHPPENQGSGGVIRHLIKCIITAKDLCDYFNLDEKDTDIVLAGAILHDIQKNGIPWGEKTHIEHAKIGADFLKKFELKEPEKTEIINCVRYHMHRFTGTIEDRERASNPTIKEHIIQMTDMFCSRKFASWLPWLELTNEQINNFSSNINPNMDPKLI